MRMTAMKDTKRFIDAAVKTFRWSKDHTHITVYRGNTGLVAYTTPGCRTDPPV
jgi:hypothetical protein